MALQKQGAAVPLTGGLETKVDPKFVTAANSLVASNVSFYATSAITPRYGTIPLPTATSSNATITSGVALSAPNGELGLQDGLNYYVYGATGKQWISRGSSVPFSLYTEPGVTNPYTQTNPTSVVLGNIIVFAWEDSRGGVRYAVRDTEDANLYYQMDISMDAAGANPQLVALGQAIYCAVTRPAGGGSELLLYQLSVQSPATPFVASASLAFGLDGTAPLYAITPFGDGVHLLVAYSVGTNVFVGLVGALGLWTSGPTSWTITLGTTPTALAVASDTAASPVWVVALSNNAGVQIMYSTGTTPFSNSGPDQRFFATFGTGCVRLTAAFAGDGTASWALFAEYPITGLAGANVWGNVRAYKFSGTVQSSTTTKYGLQLASQAAYVGGNFLATCATPTTAPLDTGYTAPPVPSNQTTYFVMRSDGHLMNRFMVQTAGGAPSKSYTSGLSNVNGQLMTALMQKTALRADASGQLYTSTGLSVITYDFTDTSSCMAVPFDNLEFVNDGKPQVFDGGRLLESGADLYPEVGAGSYENFATGGSLVNGATYTWYFTYAAQDYKGRWHRSAPSFAFTGNAGGNTGATASSSFFIPYNPLTSWTGTRGPLQVEIWRTVSNTPAPAYRVGVLNANPNVTTGALGFTYLDTASDASIQSNDTLYAGVGGEVENDPPPSFAMVVEGQRRIFGLSQEDRLSVWYSKIRVADRAPEFSEFFTLSVESTGGDLTAIGALDAAVILFKQDRIYAVTGTGPNALGLPIDGYSLPQLVSSTDGCISPRSVIKTDVGLFFQGRRGIMLLDRSLNIQYVGTPMDAYRTAPVVGSLLVPAQNQVRFVTNSNLTLVYDYLANKWSTYDYGGVGAVMQSFVTPSVLASSGVVTQESTNTYTDNGTGVRMVYRTAWLKPGAMAQGFARVWEIGVLGQYLGPHKIYVDIAYDYEPFTYTLSWNPSGVINTSVYGSESPYGSGTPYGGSGSIVYQFRSRIPRQHCQAISFQFRVELASGASCQLSELALLLGVIGEVNRLPANKTI